MPNTATGVPTGEPARARLPDHAQPKPDGVAGVGLSQQFSAQTGASPDPIPSADALLRLADQCVKCGYCLPHCPTFGLQRQEADSPRGRIALIQGWLGGDLALTASLERHLDGCLECRACEPVCPSLVQFGTLMDGARARREAVRSGPRRGLDRLWLGLLTQPRWLPMLALLARPWRRLGAWTARTQAARWPRLAVLARLLTGLQRPATGVLPHQEVPTAPLPAPDRIPDAGGVAKPITAIGPAIGLFRGCIARATEPALDAAALRVLRRIGFNVAVPTAQGCCGAMHRHNGLPAAADRHVAANVAAFAGAPVVGTASACVAELAAHSPLTVFEVCRALVDTPWPDGLTPAALPATIAVHEPCSHRNQLRDTAAVYALLRRIPDARVVPLAGNDTCCGAAGTYLIDQPETAARLGAAKIAALRELAPALLVTTNTGCALHLRTLAEAAGLAVPVLHPVEVLDRLLMADGRIDAAVWSDTDR